LALTSAKQQNPQERYSQITTVEIGRQVEQDCERKEGAIELQEKLSDSFGVEVCRDDLPFFLEGYMVILVIDVVVGRLLHHNLVVGHCG
jgi:hypothetical protein